MLSVIPGVSIQIANKIAIKYKTFPNLISEFSKCQHPEKLLNSIQITDKRKIGNVLSKKIFNNISTEFTENNEPNISTEFIKNEPNISTEFTENNEPNISTEFIENTAYDINSICKI
jgi:hypothetical protein